MLGQGRGNMTVARPTRKVIVPEKKVIPDARVNKPVDYVGIRSKAIAQKISRDGTGVFPLDVMLDNMQFYHGTAKMLAERINALLNNDPDLGEEIPLLSEYKMEADNPLSLFHLMMRFRKAAQDSAVDAAPYMHPKLAQVSHVGDNTKPIVVEVRRRIVDPKERTV